MCFDEFWMLLQADLVTGDQVTNWTAYRGNLGDTITILRVRSDAVEVDTPGAQNIQVVPKGDFQTVYALWSQYLAHEVPRQHIREQTRYSKYIISILHHLGL